MDDDGMNITSSIAKFIHTNGTTEFLQEISIVRFRVNLVCSCV